MTLRVKVRGIGQAGEADPRILTGYQAIRWIAGDGLTGHREGLLDAEAAVPPGLRGMVRIEGAKGEPLEALLFGGEGGASVRIKSPGPETIFVDLERRILWLSFPWGAEGLKLCPRGGILTPEGSFRGMIVQARQPAWATLDD